MLKTMFSLLVLLSLISACSSQGSSVRSTVNAREGAPNVTVHQAALDGDLNAVLDHVKAGTDLNQKDEYGSTALMIAITFGKDEVAKALINSGADLEIKNNEGATALFASAFFCRPEIVKLLLEKGAKKNIKDKNGVTPMQVVSSPFEEMMPIYQMLERMLGPLGLEFDYEYMKQIRPQIATMLES